MENSLPNRNKRVWAIGLLFSVLFGYLAFRNFQWEVLRASLVTIVPWPFIISGTFIGLAFCVRAFRWRFFLPRNGGFTYGSLLSGVAVGYFFSNIFPGRLGDFIRPAYIATANRKSYQVCLYSILLERVWEVVILLVIAVGLIQFSGLIGSGLLNFSLPFAFSLIVAGVLFLVFAQRLLKLFYNLFTRLKLTFLSSSLKDVMQAFEGNFTTNRKIILFLLSIAIFFLEGLFFVFILESLLLPLSFFEKLTVMVITSMGHFLPSAPAGVGVYHYFCQLSLTMFGVKSDVALSVAILVHAYWFIFDFLFGLFCIFLGPVKINHILPGIREGRISTEKRIRY